MYVDWMNNNVLEWKAEKERISHEKEESECFRQESMKRQTKTK